MPAGGIKHTEEEVLYIFAVERDGQQLGALGIEGRHKRKCDLILVMESLDVSLQNMFGKHTKAATSLGCFMPKVLFARESN